MSEKKMSAEEMILAILYEFQDSLSDGFEYYSADGPERCAKAIANTLLSGAKEVTP